MAQGILGNTMIDHDITISVEDYGEYQQLMKARQVIVDKLEIDGSISAIDLLSVLGGTKGFTLRQRLLNEIKGEREGEAE